MTELLSTGRCRSVPDGHPHITICREAVADEAARRPTDAAVAEARATEFAVSQQENGND